VEWGVLATPIGAVSVGVAQGRVCRVGFGAVPPTPRPADPVLAEALAQLRSYFAGTRTSFDLPVADPPGSAFERAVWAELARVPYGQTVTYGQVATAVGDPGAARGVGTACHRNPLPLLVPCHRVVGAGGKLVGFGGGLPAKRWLLEHEARISMESAWS